MPLWDKVKQELDRAGQVAQDAIDEGRIRLEVHRARQMADKAAEVLGYAVYRAQRAGGTLDAAELARHAAAVAEHEADVNRLEAQLATIQQRWRAAGTAAGAGAYAGSAGASAYSGGASSAAGAATVVAEGPAPDEAPIVDVSGSPSSGTAETPPSDTAPGPFATPDNQPGEGPGIDPWRKGDIMGQEPY